MVRLSTPACALIAVATMVLSCAPALAQTHYAMAEGSTLALDGSTVLGGFTCHSGDATGAASTSPGGPVAASVSIPVASFDCGNGRMNRDLFDALRGSEHAAIRFRLDRTDTATDTDAATDGDSDGWMAVRVWGTLTLAGVARPVRIEVQGRRQGDRFHLRGHHELRMTDFAVRPPSGPLGLVRARDAVTVRFDLVARQSGRP